MSNTRSGAPAVRRVSRTFRFTKVPTSILDALSLAKLPGREWNLVIATMRKTLGWNKGEDRISLSQFEGATGIDRTGICRCLKSLVDKGILFKRQIGSRSFYRINMNIQSWACLRIRAVANSTTGSGENDNQVVANPPLTKETITKETKTKDNAPSASDDTEVLSLVRSLKEKVLENKPDRKLSSNWTQKTADAIDKMIRLDGRNPERIKEVIQWCQSDNEPRGSGNFCWAINIVSGEKLRKQFDRLETDMRMFGYGKDEHIPTEEELRAAWARKEAREGAAQADAD